MGRTGAAAVGVAVEDRVAQFHRAVGDADAAAVALVALVHGRRVGRDGHVVELGRRARAYGQAAAAVDGAVVAQSAVDHNEVAVAVDAAAAAAGAGGHVAADEAAADGRRAQEGVEAAAAGRFVVVNAAVGDRQLAGACPIAVVDAAAAVGRQVVVDAAEGDARRGRLVEHDAAAAEEAAARARGVARHAHVGHGQRRAQVGQDAAALVVVGVAAGDGHVGQGQLHLGSHGQHAVDAGGVEGRLRAAGAGQRQIFQDVQVALGGEVLLGQRQRRVKDVVAGGHDDGVGAVARRAGVHRLVVVGGADGFAQRAIAVVVVLVVGGGHGDGRRAGRRGQHAPHRQGQQQDGRRAPSPQRPAAAVAALHTTSSPHPRLAPQAPFIHGFVSLATAHMGTRERPLRLLPLGQDSRTRRAVHREGLPILGRGHPHLGRGAGFSLPCGAGFSLPVGRINPAPRPALGARLQPALWGRLQPACGQDKSCPTPSLRGLGFSPPCGAGFSLPAGRINPAPRPALGPNYLLTERTLLITLLIRITNTIY